MGKVSCGSNKGKWSYLYAGRPTTRLEQKSLTTFFKKTYLKPHSVCRVHIELERSRDLGYQRQPSPQMDRFRALGIDRAVENAELQVFGLNDFDHHHRRSSRTYDVYFTVNHHSRMMCTSPWSAGQVGEGAERAATRPSWVEAQPIRLREEPSGDGTNAREGLYLFYFALFAFGCNCQQSSLGQRPIKAKF